MANNYLERVWKEATILKYYPGICLKGLRKIAKILRPVRPRLNPGPLENEVEVVYFHVLSQNVPGA
jgi:hypothetical protein